MYCCLCLCCLEPDRVQQTSVASSCDLAGLGLLEEDYESVNGSFVTSTPIKQNGAFALAKSEDNSYNPIEDCETPNVSTNALEVEKPMWQREYFMVARECLWQLLSICPKCSGECMVDISKRMGSFIAASRKCWRCELDTNWNSQPFHGSLPAGNLKMAASMHFTAASPTKVLRVFDKMNLAHISYPTYWRLQTTLLQPTVWSCWLSHQQMLFEELRAANRPLALAGDSRSDSPGHCAQFGSYSVLETTVNKIIHFELIKVCCTKICYCITIYIYSVECSGKVVCLDSTD